MDEDITINDDSEYGQIVHSIKEIALRHISKISSICCEEFSKGYWEEKPVKVGGGIAIVKKYHPDNRAVFCNSVDFLLWIVYPMSDDTFKNTYKDFKGDEGDLDAKLKERKILFREINIMFERTKFFDSMSGKTE